MTPEQIVQLKAELIAQIMKRQHAASGVAVFVDPVVLCALFDKALASLNA
jgi:hypothetical protein